MEVVIVLPLHLVLLLSVIWLGTLQTDYFRLMEMDYFHAFRKEMPLAELKNFYFKDNSSLILTDESSAETAGSGEYLYFSGSRLKAEQRAVPWVAGINVLGKKMFGNTDDAVADRTFTVQSGAAQTSLTVLKNPGYSKDRSTSADWAGIVNEPFLGNPAHGMVSGAEVAEYSRNVKLELWSAE